MATPTAHLPKDAIFDEREGWVFYVSNWQARRTTGGRAVLVRLSPRHFARYHQLKEKGRSAKTICYLLFRKKPAALGKRGSGAVEAPAAGRIEVDIAILTSEQLVALAGAELGARIGGLRALPLADLRKLVLALQEQRRKR
jgi:hypothetical protein